MIDIKKLYSSFLKEFDLVGIIKTKRYILEASNLNLDINDIKFPTIIALGLNYPKRNIKSNKDEVVGSIYTFGQDYHQVLKNKINKVMENYNIKYELGVDNHPHNERLIAKLSGIGYFAKNQLIINSTYGSFLFLGIVMLDIEIKDEIILDSFDSCGDCRICLDACPTKALSDNGYDVTKCISYYNQEKIVLSDNQIKNNYSLFGCDICQLVCPKNINVIEKNHPEFSLSGKETVKIIDLFKLSDKDFRLKYNNMAYLWKGKTILLRNALTILLRQKNTSFNEEIRSSINKYQAPWYKITAKNILDKLDKIKESTV
jgi:epoxyqueuosine reductase